MCLSVPQIAAAATRIRISSGPGLGLGRSSTCVPDGPSSVVVLTTASIEASEARRSYHGVRELRPAPQLAADPTECAVDDLVAQRRRAGHVVAVAREVLRELMDGPDERVAVAVVEVFVLAALDDVDALVRCGAGVVELVRERAGTGLVLGAVQDHQRHFQRAHDGK